MAGFFGSPCRATTMEPVAVCTFSSTKAESWPELRVVRVAKRGLPLFWVETTFPVPPAVPKVGQEPSSEYCLDDCRRRLCTTCKRQRRRSIIGFSTQISVIWKSYVQGLWIDTHARAAKKSLSRKLGSFPNPATVFSINRVTTKPPKRVIIYLTWKSRIDLAPVDRPKTTDRKPKVEQAFARR